MEYVNMKTRQPKKEFEAEILREYWSNGKPITFNGKTYSVNRMSYGDYFFTPKGKERPETEGFAKGTIWPKIKKPKGA